MTSPLSFQPQEDFEDEADDDHDHVDADDVDVDVDVDLFLKNLSASAEAGRSTGLLRDLEARPMFTVEKAPQRG